MNIHTLKDKRNNPKPSIKLAGTLLSVSIIGILSACSNSSQPLTNTNNQASASSQSLIETGLTYPIIDTQQQLCFDNEGATITCPTISDALYGQDAQFEGIKASYTNNQDGTVTDNVTRLMWQKTPDYQHYQYDDAINYCANLEVGGYDDWRLATIKELYSLADFRGEIVDPSDNSNNTPYIDTDYFDFQYDQRMAYIGQYWSSTKYTRGPVHDTENVDAAFGFNFADGHIKAYETGYVFGTDNKTVQAPGNFVRCVRAPENVYGVNDFVTNNDGTVTDNATGLMWQQADDETRYTWQDALKVAKNAKLAGHNDWRLPNAKELQSIVDYNGKVGEFPAIDTQFFTLSADNTVADPTWVWTNTTQGDFKYTADYISFGKSFSKKNSSATTYYDWHGAGAQRSDPKSGNPADYDMASENAADLVMTKNYVLLVRDAK